MCVRASILCEHSACALRWAAIDRPSAEMNGGPQDERRRQQEAEMQQLRMQLDAEVRR